MSVIYKISCKANGKSYIGKTENTFEERYQGGRFWASTHNRVLQDDAYKYGESQFEVITLATSDLVGEDLEKLEQWFIREHKTAQPMGYNVTVKWWDDLESFKQNELESAKKWDAYLKENMDFIDSCPAFGKKDEVKIRFKILVDHVLERQEERMKTASLITEHITRIEELGTKIIESKDKTLALLEESIESKNKAVASLDESRSLATHLLKRAERAEAELARIKRKMAAFKMRAQANTYCPLSMQKTNNVIPFLPEA